MNAELKVTMEALDSHYQGRWKTPVLWVALSVVGLLINSCQETNELAKRPNILWLYVEDISPNLGCYGDENVKTPNIDELADNGIRFTRL